MDTFLLSLVLVYLQEKTGKLWASMGLQMLKNLIAFFFFFSSRRRHTKLQGDWSSDVCSSDLMIRHTRLQGDWSSDVCSSDHGIRDYKVTGVQTCALPI